MKRENEVLIKKRNRNLITAFISFLIALTLLSCSKDETKDLSSSNSLDKVFVDDYHEVYIEINNDDKTVELLIPFNSILNINQVKLSIRISENATSNINQEKTYNLTEPFQIEIVAEDGSIAKYTLYAQKCEGGKAAVIVSDTQKDILPLYREEDFFVKANIVLDKAFNAEVSIYYLMLTSLKGTDDWDLPDQLHYYDNGKMVDKEDSFDGFDGTILHREFLINGISKVYVIGVSSMGCVLGTCRGASRLKYELTLISDAHDEPIGYRDESAIDKCNQKFSDENLGQLIEAEDLVF